MTSYIRVGAANVEVRACEEHLKQVFDIINSHKDLLAACKLLTYDPIHLDSESLQKVIVLARNAVAKAERVKDE